MMLGVLVKVSTKVCASASHAPVNEMLANADGSVKR